MRRRTRTAVTLMALGAVCAAPALAAKPANHRTKLTATTRATVAGSVVKLRGPVTGAPLGHATIAMTVANYTDHATYEFVIRAKGGTLSGLFQLATGRSTAAAVLTSGTKRFRRADGVLSVRVGKGRKGTGRFVFSGTLTY